MSNKLDWTDNELNSERLRKVYNFVNWLMFEMQEGRVATMKVPLAIAFAKMAEKGEIDEITANEHNDLFLPWSTNTSYQVGDLRNYDGSLYKCLQAHASQENWTPDVSASLWKSLSITENGIQEWSQPISALDAYNVGDEVMYNGVHYKSLIDNNVWSPETYSQGWEVVVDDN